MNSSAKKSTKTTAPRRIGLTIPEAAATLGVSKDYFLDHILPEIRIVRRGRLRIVPIIELELWLDKAAARTLEAA